MVDLAIQVDPLLSASCAHHLAEEVRLRILAKAEEPICEVLVHVDTSPHDYACPLQASVLSGARTHREVQTDVAQLLRNLPEVNDVSRVAVHYLEGGLAVEAHVRVSDHFTVAELRSVAAVGRETLMSTSSDLVDVAVVVDLTASSSSSTGSGTSSGAPPSPTPAAPQLTPA